MFCVKCGKEMDEGAKFCRFCGQPSEAPAWNGQPDMMTGRGGQPAKKNALAKVFLALAAVLAAVVLVIVGLNFAGGGSKTKKASEKDSGRETDEKAEEKEPARDAAQVLQAYLDDVLEKQYGYADLKAKKLVLTGTDELYNMDLSQYDNWQQAAGMTDYAICDLDGDGQDELVAAFVDGEKAGIAVYEAEGDDVVKKAEIAEARAVALDGYGTVWTMAEADGKRYLLWWQEEWGVLADGYDRNMRLWQYDGNGMRTVMEIIQTAGGSSDFEYTAFQYDEKGETSLTEVVYRENYGENQFIGEDYYKPRVGELLAGYGIGADDAVFLYAVHGGLGDRGSSDVKGQMLLRLEQSGDYQGDRLVYRFNDWDGPRKAYLNFLEGKEKVYVGMDAVYGMEAQSGYTVGEIFDKVKSSFDNSFGNYAPRLEYAFLDCGDDGVEDLAIRVIGLNIYSEGDDSDATMVITRRNGRLEMVYACESWARSYSEVNYYGCVSGGGSSGAGDSTSFLAYIDGGGNYNPVYECNQLWGMWTSYLDDDAYRQLFGNGEPSLSVEIWYVGDSTYYVANIPEDDVQRGMAYVDQCRQKGMNFVASEEAERVVWQRKMELGVKEEWLSKGWFSEGEVDATKLYWLEQYIW